MSEIPEKWWTIFTQGANFSVSEETAAEIKTQMGLNSNLDSSNWKSYLTFTTLAGDIVIIPRRCFEGMVEESLESVSYFEEFNQQIDQLKKTIRGWHE